MIYRKIFCIYYIVCFLLKLLFFSIKAKILLSRVKLLLSSLLHFVTLHSGKPLMLSRSANTSGPFFWSLTLKTAFNSYSLMSWWRQCDIRRMCRNEQGATSPQQALLSPAWDWIGCDVFALQIACATYSNSKPVCGFNGPRTHTHAHTRKAQRTHGTNKR